MSILSRVGSILNDVTGVTSSRKAENEYTTQMWNAANEYNTPSAQLARMAEAGIDINPTSYALGTNNLSNTTNAVSSAHGAPAGNPISTLMSVVSGAMGVATALQQLSLMDENTMNANIHGKNMITEGEGIKLRNESIRLNNQIAQHNLDVAGPTRPVGYVPTVIGDPIGYGADVGQTFGNLIAGW